MSNSHTNKLTSSPTQLSQLYARVLTAWGRFSRLDFPLSREHQKEYVEFLRDLAHLQETPFLKVWESKVDASVIALSLLDLSADNKEELLAVTSRGRVYHFRRPLSPDYKQLQGGQLSVDALPVVGIQKIQSTLDYAPTAYIVTGGNPERPLHRPFYTATDKIEFDARRSRGRTEQYLTISQHFDKFESDGLLRLFVTLSAKGTPRLVGNSFDQRDKRELPFWPAALINTASHAWLGDSAERVTSWLWQGGRLQQNPNWPENGAAVDGRITAMTLWLPLTEANNKPDPLLLVATDKRWLFILDTAGQIIDSILLPQVATAMLTAPNDKYLFVAFEDNCLTCLEPIHPALNPSIPTLLAAFNRLQPDTRIGVWHDWLQGDDPQLVVAAVTTMTTKGAAPKVDTLRSLVKSLAREKPEFTKEDELPKTTKIKVLEGLEKSFFPLNKTTIDLSLSMLKAPKAWHENRESSPTLRRRIDLFTARLAAHFGEKIKLAPDYQALRRARRQSDRERAAADLSKDRPQQALALYGKILVERRELDWLFATDSAIRALLPLADSPQVLFATRTGGLHLYDLTQHKRIETYKLPIGTVPQAMALGASINPQKDTLALVTSHGDLFMGSVKPDNRLGKLEKVGQLEGDVWGIAFVPMIQGTPLRLVAGSSGGWVTVYVRDAQNQWRAERRIGKLKVKSQAAVESDSKQTLKAEYLYSLGVSVIEPGGVPAIFVGGTSTDGQGVLYQLNLEGGIDQEHHFPDTVLDARTLKVPDSPEKHIAVACNDGYLYFINANGTLKWRYKAGRAVRSVTICDIDEDGEQEIIIGGEQETGTDEEAVQENNITVLSLTGAVQWVIPAEALVTHIATALDENGRPLLLAADLENVLRGIRVIPPRGKQEQEICTLADACLTALSEKKSISSSSLLNQWQQNAQQPFLQGYTFYHLAKQALQGSQEALDILLETDIGKSPNAAQRTYARILVNLATMSSSANAEARMQAARTHLLKLIRHGTTRHSVGVAALRQLMLPGSLKGQTLPDWQPFLEEAAQHADQSVRRAVLYALRVFNPIAPEEADLWPEAWEILSVFFTTDDHIDNTWLTEDMAVLIRDLANNDAALWMLAHRVFARATDLTAVDTLLEGLDYDLLDNRPLIETIKLLVKLHRTTDPETAGHVLLTLPNHFNKALGKASTLQSENTTSRTLLEFYALLAEAVQLSTFVAWEKFIADNTPSGGLSRLTDRLINCLMVEDRRFVDNLAVIRNRINDFQNEPGSSPDVLRRLMDRLRNLAELLCQIAVRGLAEDMLLNNILFYRITAGLFWCWFHETGVLQTELDRLTQPVTPQLEILTAFRRGDQIRLDVRINNPGFQYAFEDFRLRLNQIRLHYQGKTLSCELETFFAQDNLTIKAQSHRDLRLTVSVPATGNTPSSAAEAELTLPVDYFLPPKEWQRGKELTAVCQVEDKLHVRLDWENDFPQQAAAARRQISHELTRNSQRPVLVEAPPLIRQGVVGMLRRLSGSGPTIDMRQWRFQQQRLGDRLNANEAAMLAWLAKQLWPEATADIDNIRLAGAPRYNFQQLSAKQRPLPNFIIFSNWEQLLFQLSRVGDQWQPLEQILPFLLGWAQKQGVRLLFVGTYLMEEILRTRWPDLFANFAAIRCDRLDIEQERNRNELVQAIQAMLQEETLQAAVAHLVPRPTADWLANWCRGYLHVLEFVCLHALAEAQQAPPLRKTHPETYLYNFARQTNFYNSLWLWQPFFDRIAVILVAYAEFAIERREWIQPGMTLSQDYYARRPDGRLVPQPTLRAGHTLDVQDVTIIRSNRHYQRYDATVRGYIPGQVASKDPPAPPVARLLQQLLTAGGGRERLDRMVENGILRRRLDRRFGDYYEIGVPFLGRWLRQTNIWQHLQRSVVGQEDSWYPAHIAYNQLSSGNRSAQLWLFPEHIPGAAFRDIPLTHLPAIDQALSSETKDSFYNLYGLSRRGDLTPTQRWQALVDLAQQLDHWQRLAHVNGERRQIMEPFFNSLEELLNVKRLTGQLPDVKVIPKDAGVRIFWAMADLFTGELVLQTSVLLAVVRRGRELAERSVDFRQWVRDELARLHKEQEPGLRESEYVEMMERSAAICLVATEADALRRALPPNRGGPHFIFLDLVQLTTFATAANPARRLIHHTFHTIGRHPFSPYKLHGSLDKGSDLFVGRRQEVNAILGSLEREDHAILGSRRIGKTSILHQLDHLLNQREPGQRPLTISLHLQDSSQDRDFYYGIQTALRETPYAAWSQELSSKPAASYQDLLLLMQRLRQEYDHPIVFLIDEIDGLYLWDKGHNDQRLFQFLRNALAQPRICTFVMTGYRYIYLERLKVSSVFHNFCRFHNLLGIEPDGVSRLVELLRHLDIEIEDQEGVEGLIEKGTYGIPYYVQRACDKLLHRADILQRQAVAPDDAETILEQDIQKQLKQELWDKLLSEAHPLDRRLAGSRNESVDVRNLKIKVLLLTTLLELYQHQFQGGIEATEPLMFTAEDMISFARALCPELCPRPWNVTPEEVHQLMIPVTFTLALAPVETETGVETYCFPNDILPDVLYAQQRQRQIDLINELANVRQALQNKLTRR